MELAGLFLFCLPGRVEQEMGEVEACLTEEVAVDFFALFLLTEAGMSLSGGRDTDFLSCLVMTSFIGGGFPAKILFIPIS